MSSLLNNLENYADVHSAITNGSTQDAKPETQDSAEGVYLVATAGDCAAGGLGEKADAILIPEQHYDLVAEFIRAQAENEVALYLDNLGGKFPSEISGRLVAAGQALRTAGVFKHKWHARTSWALEDGDCLDNYGPVNLVK